ncbi:Secreted glycosyl hydrolase [Streptomyces sp. A7024]|uniref:Secreted glycosyl hydrolase n=1 Tax=Streptomyces coryli TaxID=1128680 RepID=A0A6G4U6R3_9ACTN|nr:discoidin domain-containing protein [Streptomyces coryli]NGN67793.1 Secreted glycosyl hydrolase [Streptomyces coryli]
MKSRISPYYGRRLRARWRPFAALLAATLLLLGLPTFTATAAGGPDLAAGRTATASSAKADFGAARVTDGNQGTYWESSGSDLPQWVQVDLGESKRVDEVELRLPAGWEERKQTLSVQGSADGTGFHALASSTAHTFSPANANTVKVGFAAAQTRFVRINITANTGWSAGQLAELKVFGAGDDSSANLALGKTFKASTHTQSYVAANAGDGNRASYWESENGKLPQWVQADLGAGLRVNKVVLKLPAGWEERKQTLKLQTSQDGENFTDLTAAKEYTFAPGTDNSATITFDTATTRYVRALISANTVQSGGQLSELEVYGPATGDTQAPTAPKDLALTEPASGQIKLTWGASDDDKGVTGYDIYANGELRTSVEGNVTSYTDTQPASATVTYYVRARDAAGNQSPNSNSVTRKGDSGDTQAPTAPANLAYTEPASGQIKLTWGAATDNVKVTAYDIYAGGEVLKTVDGGTTTYTDTRPASATVTYSVRAKDAAGNVSAPSNSVTRQGTGDGANLAVGKPITASSTTQTYKAENANDDSTATYWEGAAGSYPNTLTVKLGANADVSAVVVKLNPDPAWSTRTQKLEVLGRTQDATDFTSLAAEKEYSFSPSGNQNAVKIPVSGRVADVRLKFTANSGASAGQAAEFQVLGTAAPNPDLEVTKVAHTPEAPVESDMLTLSATVRNGGKEASGATDVAFRLAGEKVDTAALPALAPGESTTVSAVVSAREAGSYPLSATADDANKVVETDEGNNTLAAAAPIVVKPIQSSDLVPSVSWTPSAPTSGKDVDFAVTVKNQGTQASAAGSHAITLTVQDANGATVKTLTGAHSGTIGAGDSAPAVKLGPWTAANGHFSVKVTVAPDANEAEAKRENNTATRSLYVGRGADMPYETYEAEDAAVGGGAQVVGPSRDIGAIDGEASGRKAVTLNETGASVEFTTKEPTNTLVTRFSIPDAAGGGGINATLNVYVDGKFRKALDLTSKYAWLYGAEGSPGNTPSAGPPRHIYDEAHLFLDGTVPAGSKIKLQKDTANTSKYAIDFIDVEQVAPDANPDPAAYAVPTGFTHQDVQNALDKVRMDTTGKLTGVYLPAGDYETSSKFQVYGKAVKVVGAGPWYTRFHAPKSQENTDIGFRAEKTASGSAFSGFAYFGNYTSRIDGPGKVFDFQNVSDITIDNVWNEHMVCLYWGANTDNMTIKNSRIRNMFADGINMTNGSTGNRVANNESRASGDDSFALFSAIDAGGADMKDNVYENLTSLLTWRAAGIAVYGGYNNTFRNIRIADTLVYSGITISSLDFGYPMNGFGTEPTTFENITIDRSGGHFWGGQTFPGIWLFSASKAFQGIRINNVDINSPTYSGVMFQTKYTGSQPENPVKDTILRDVTIRDARKSGDAYDHKSGIGIWVNEMAEAGQGPAVGEATFHNLKLINCAEDIRNRTTTFKLNILP